MEDVPMPSVLDVDQLASPEQLHNAPAEQQVDRLGGQLRELTAYAAHLWRQVDAGRRYLIEVLPDPDAGDDATRLLTAPRGAADDHGWDRWRTAYGSLTSVLAGPKGDAGFGEQEARRETDLRRGPAHASDRTAELLDAARATDAVVAASREALTAEDSRDPVSGPTETPTAGTFAKSATSSAPAAASKPAGKAGGALTALPAAIAAVAMVVGYALGRRGSRSSGAASD